MKTGFWLRTNNNFIFMDDEEIRNELGTISTPYQFLDGLCHSFAAALKYSFNYKIEVIINNNGSIVHAYAVHKGHYIDVRGANNDWDEFISMYDNAIPTHNRNKLNIQTFEDTFTEFNCDNPEDYSEIIADDAFIIIESHPEYYKIS